MEKEILNNIKKWTVCFCLLFILVSCNWDIPDGKGKILVTNEISDVCYIDKVWVRKRGTLEWKLEWDDGDEYNNTDARVYIDPGEYAVRVRIKYLNTVPVEYFSGIFNSLIVEEGETSYINFNGILLYQQ